MDLTDVAADLLDPLPAHRTLGLRVEQAKDGIGRVSLPVDQPVHNIVHALHSSGVTALVDAAALAAMLSAAPDEATARRIQPLGVETRLTFSRPVRGTAVAECRLSDYARHALDGLFDGAQSRVRISTSTTVDADDEPAAADGAFDWTVRLAPV